MPARFWQKVAITDSGCWEWSGAKAGGRGQLQWKCSDGVRRRVSAYRLAFQIEHGAIDPLLTIDHLCENPCCCNPDHLEQVTNEENTRRFFARHPVTHCPRGHAKTDDNVYINGAGARICKICHADRMRAYNARIRKPRPVRFVDTAGILRTARIAIGLRLQDLAASLGIKHNTLSTWERGLRSIDPDALPKIEMALGIKAELLGAAS